MIKDFIRRFPPEYKHDSDSTSGQAPMADSLSLSFRFGYATDARPSLHHAPAMLARQTDDKRYETFRQPQAIHNGCISSGTQVPYSSAD